jgi:hypothetical protein
MLRYAYNCSETVWYLRARFEFLDGTAVVGTPYQGRSLSRGYHVRSIMWISEVS